MKGESRMSQNNIKIRVSVGKFYDDISKNKKKTKQTMIEDYTDTHPQDDIQTETIVQETSQEQDDENNGQAVIFNMQSGNKES